jgi:HK97 gp10 family phage protein
MFKVTIQGMDGFLRKLQQLERDIQQRILLDALKAGAQILVDEAKSIAPRLTGAMAAGIHMEIQKSANLKEVLMQVGPSRKQFYARFVEKGTKYARRKPFLGPALERNRDRISETIKRKILDGISRTVNS